MSNGDDCRTAPATPGLLNTQFASKVLYIKKFIMENYFEELEIFVYFRQNSCMYDDFLNYKNSILMNYMAAVPDGYHANILHGSRQWRSP